MTVDGQIANVSTFVNLLSHSAYEPNEAEDMVAVIVRDECVVDGVRFDAGFFELDEQTVAAAAVDEKVFAGFVGEREARVIALCDHGRAGAKHSDFFHSEARLLVILLR